jgi:hypothetical protein
LSLICSVLNWQKQEEDRILHQLKDKMETKQISDPSADWVDDILSDVGCSAAVPPSQTHRALENLNHLKAKIVEFDQEDENSNSRGDSEDGDLTGADPSSLDISELHFPQIFYCSRTHSQISQFIHEIKRTCYSSVRCISLASRAHMCINPEINSSRSDSTISEKCLDLQRTASVPKEIDGVVAEPKKRRRSSSGSKTCPFHCAAKEKRFVEHSFGKIRDIEELVELGSQIKSCPYYGLLSSSFLP